MKILDPIRFFCHIIISDHSTIYDVWRVNFVCNFLDFIVLINTQFSNESRTKLINTPKKNLLVNVSILCKSLLMKIVEFVFVLTNMLFNDIYYVVVDFL